MWCFRPRDALSATWVPPVLCQRQMPQPNADLRRARRVSIPTDRPQRSLPEFYNCVGKPWAGRWWHAPATHAPPQHLSSSPRTRLRRSPEKSPATRHQRPGPRCAHGAQRPPGRHGGRQSRRPVGPAAGATSSPALGPGAGSRRRRVAACLSAASIGRRRRTTASAAAGCLTAGRETVGAGSHRHRRPTRTAGTAVAAGVPQPLQR